jgi:predicted dehydrogenase
MKYAVIGTGYWGSNHVRVASELLEESIIDEVVLCDVDEGRVGDLAETYDAEYTTDFAELPSMGVDAATVAIPATRHHEIASQLLETGLDLLVEKPLATTSEQAWDLTDRAERNGCTLGVGHIFRYHPALSALQDRIRRGEFGRIKYLNTTRFAERVPRPDTGVLYSLAIHDVDVYRFLLRETPERVYCNLDCVLREDVDETATVILEYGDVTGVINASWQVPVFGKRRDLVVVGTEKAAFIDYLAHDTIEVYETRIQERDGRLELLDEGVHEDVVEDGEPLRIEVETFLTACETGGPLPANGEVGAEAVELLEACERSARDNRVVRLDG